MWTCTVCERHYERFRPDCQVCGSYYGSTNMYWKCINCQCEENRIEDNHCSNCGNERMFKYVERLMWECRLCNVNNSIRRCEFCTGCRGSSGFSSSQLPYIEKSTLMDYAPNLVDGTDCIVCDTFIKSSDKVGRLTCGHIYCSKCIDQWVYSDNNNALRCPSCRNEINLKTKTMFMNYFSDSDTNSKE